MRSDVFLFGSTHTAGSLLEAFKRAHHAGTAHLGQDGSVWVRRRGHTEYATLAWREGSDVGVVVVGTAAGASTASALALQYAKLADSNLRIAPPATAWDRVMSQVSSGGDVSPGTALQAVALAYGSIPGVSTPSGSGGVALSGDLAAGWIRPYLNRLPARQRKVVEQRLGIIVASHTARAACVLSTYGDPSFKPSSGLQSIANLWAAEFASHLGPLRLTMVVGTANQKPVPKALDYADATPLLDDSGDEGSRPQLPKLCRIRIFPRATAQSLSGQEWILAHEVFHCFQFQLLGASAWAAEPPDWVMEGMATWAAFEVDPTMFPPAVAKILDYIGDPHTPLFARTYDAVGFWLHLQDIDASFWSLIPGILNGGSSTADFNATGADGPTFIDSWGGSVLRADHTIYWDMISPFALPGFGSLKPGGFQSLAGASTVQAVPYSTSQYQITGGPVVHVAIRGTARLSVTHNYAKLTNEWFCTTSICVCPPKTVGVVPPTQPLDPGALLALTGDPGTGADGDVTTYPISYFCHPIPMPPGPGGGGGGSLGCHQDCGSTGGDPHVATFAGDGYDFQAAGEFTLVKSRSGDLNVQVRQQPWPGSGDVSIDSAVAIRVGNATVEVDAGKPSGKEIVWVNRARLSSGGVQRRSLSGGGKLLAVGDIVNLTWPDGSIVQVTAGTDSGCGNLLGVALKVARKRFGHLSGLLGDAGAGAGTEFVSGGGHRYSAAEIENPGASSQAFNALYHEFGQSWRISQRDSLFMYAKGRSTSSYTDRSFPSKALTLGTLTATQFAAGQRTCSAKGVTSPSLLGDCVVDVGATAKQCFADAAKRLQAATGGPPALAGGVSPIGWTQLSAHPDADPVLYPSLASAGGRPIAAYQAAGLSGIEVATFSASPTGIGSVGRSDPVTGWYDIDGGPLLFPKPGGGLQMIFSGHHTAGRDPLNGTDIAPLQSGGTFGAPGNAGVKAYPSTGTRPHVDSGAVLAADGQTPVWTATSGFSLQLERGTPNATSADLSNLVPGQVPHDPTLARDTSGRLWLAWYAQTHDSSTNGQWMLQLDPTGAGPAPGATPRHAPGSGLSFGTIGSPALVCTQTCRIVYKDFSEDRIVLWGPGQSAPTTLAIDPGQVLDPSAVYTASGRLWLTWIEISTQRVLSALVSTSGTGGQPIILQKPNGYDTPLYSASLLDGNLLVLVTNWENGNSGTGTGQTAVFATVIPGGG